MPRAYQGAPRTFRVDRVIGLLASAYRRTAPRAAINQPRDPARPFARRCFCLVRTVRQGPFGLPVRPFLFARLALDNLLVRAIIAKGLFGRREATAGRSRTCRNDPKARASICRVSRRFDYGCFEFTAPSTGGSPRAALGDRRGGESDGRIRRPGNRRLDLRDADDRAGRSSPQERQPCPAPWSRPRRSRPRRSSSATWTSEYWIRSVTQAGQFRAVNMFPGNTRSASPPRASTRRSRRWS